MTGQQAPRTAGARPGYEQLRSATPCRRECTSTPTPVLSCRKAYGSRASAGLSPPSAWRFRSSPSLSGWATSSGASRSGARARHPRNGYCGCAAGCREAGRVHHPGGHGGTPAARPRLRRPAAHRGMAHAVQPGPQVTGRLPRWHGGRAQQGPGSGSHGRKVRVIPNGPSITVVGPQPSARRQ